MAVVTRPGPATVVVAGVVVAVSTVAAPSTQVMVVPVCEQVADCAWAMPGSAMDAAAMAALLSSATRVVVIVMKFPFCANSAHTPPVWQ